MSSNSSPGSSAGVDFAPFGFNETDAISQAPGRSIDLVRFLFDHWRKLVLGFGAGLAAGIVFYLITGHRYDASTRILVSKMANTPLQEGEATTYGDRAEHVELIRSDVIVRRAMELGNLNELPTFAHSDEPVRDLIEALKVKRTAGQDRSFMNILDITYQSPDGADAARVVRAIVDAYGEYLDKTREEQSAEVLSLIREAEGKLHQEIEQLKREYQDFRKSAPLLFHNPVGNPAPNGGTSLTPPNHYLAAVDQLYREQRSNQQRRTNVQAQLDVIRAMRAEGESRKAIEQYVLMAMSQRGPGSESGGGSGGATNPLLTVSPAKDRLDARLLEVQIQEANLIHHLGPEHPEVEKLRKTIDGIRDSYQAQGLQPPAFAHFDQSGAARPREGIDLAGVYEKFLEEQLRQIELSDQSIDRQLADAIAKAKEHAEYEVVDKQLSDELQRKQALWDGIVSKLNLVDFTKKQTGFRMMQVSDILVELSIKRVLKVVGAGGMLGALCLFGIQYFREWQDTSLRTLNEVGLITDASLMGIVPHFDTITESDVNPGMSPALCYFHRPGSREAEAYRSLRTRLFFETAHENDRVIQLTSPEPDDGKSTCAANLAIAVAQSGKRVLVIDADLRHPAIHELFGLTQEIGLADVLQREIEWLNAVKPTAVDGLFALTTGGLPDNPAEMLATVDLGTLIEAARREFDFVIVDTPPLLAVSDACIVSPHVDGVLLVVRMRKNTRPAVARAKDVLTAHGAAVYGVIANDVDVTADLGTDPKAYSSYYRASAELRPQQGPVEANRPTGDPATAARIP